MRKYKNRVWEDYIGKKLLLVAMSIVLLTHASILYYTMPQTYDAYVHIFFADHYSRFWFEPWEYRWYTGFLTISYPPLVHQMVGLISKVFPLKVAFCIYAIFLFEVLVIGIYRFAKLFFDKTTAGVAALVAVALSSIVETLHVYGQLPTLNGLSFLLNALPFLYQFIRTKRPVYLVMALTFLGVTISAHHVTALFGMIFFIAPTIFMALVDNLSERERRFPLFRFLGVMIEEALGKFKQLATYGVLMISMMVGLIFPYWYWSKAYPITQVSIPHGSRDNFLKVASSGLVFYVIPLALIIALLPAISFAITQKKRFMGWAVSFFMCMLFGSGGTTPITIKLLGKNAFNILTLDRFGFWASIIAIPFIARFILSFLSGQVQDFWVKRIKRSNHFILSVITGFSYLIFLVFVFYLARFRPLQPKEVEIQPILNFLNRDEHMRWRYLTLGFGDQMAWLSANSLAATVDGNYHSARRLPELTTRPVERLENAKFSGDEGLASLTDFLTYAQKYSLKYVFSNDRYYDPLLYYTGWNRTIRLENGIMVWEKGNISTIKPVTPVKISPIMRYAWGILPVSSLCFAIIMTCIYLWRFKEIEYIEFTSMEGYGPYPKMVMISSSLMPVIFFSGFLVFQVYELLMVKEQVDPITTMQNYYNHLDFQEFEKVFHFFKPSPTYTLDQYLLEKSVGDGGLLPSYAKLDSIGVKELRKNKDSALVKVFTRWRTSLGHREKLDTFQLYYLNKKWYVEPHRFVAEIPDLQMRSYSYTIFKKVGKRVISSFPTVKDDRVKKPFAAFKQVNFIRYNEANFVTGEIVNADDIPTNIALTLNVTFKDGSFKNYYPLTGFQYNLSPKSTSTFQIPLDNSCYLDSARIQSMSLYAETDVSERGYIHGGTVLYHTQKINRDSLLLNVRFYDELTLEMNIPGVLLTEKDPEGRIWQSKLLVFPTAVRSGLSLGFRQPISKIQNQARRMDYPIQVIINGQPRTILPLKKDEWAQANNGITMVPHCFMSQELYLQ